MRRISLLAIFGLALSGCGGLEKKVVGTYKLQFVAKFDNGMIATGDVGETLQINRDHTATKSFDGKKSAYDWKLSGNELTLTGLQKEEVWNCSVSADGQTLAILNADGEPDFKYVRLVK